MKMENVNGNARRSRRNNNWEILRSRLECAKTFGQMLKTGCCGTLKGELYFVRIIILCLRKMMSINLVMLDG